MAAIDKTYCKTYQEYLELVDWCKNNTFTCPNGCKVEFHCYEWEEKDFNGTELPVINTSNIQDYFLIKYCPLKVIQDRMKEVHGDYNSIRNGTSNYDTFVYPKQGTKVKLISSWSNIIYPYRRNYYQQFIEVYYNNQLLWYYDALNKFALPYELVTGSCSSSKVTKCKTLKALIRQLRKLNLPVGAEIKVTGRYIGEYYNFKVY